MNYQATILFSLYMFLGVHQAENSLSTNENHKLRGTYCCFSSASWFIYNFLDDSTFEYKTEGHFGRTKTVGRYTIDLDTVRLVSFSKERQTDSFYFKKMGILIIKNDSCLISTNNEFHCKITPEGYCYPN